MRRICDDSPRSLCEVNADVPPWLADVIARLMAKDRNDRFQSADEVADVLEQCLAHVQHPTSVCLPDAVCESSSPKKHAPRQPDKPRWMIRATWIGGSTIAGCVLIVTSCCGSSGPRAARHRRHWQVIADRPRGTCNRTWKMVTPQWNRRLQAQWDEDISAELNDIGRDLMQLDDAVSIPF